MQNCTFLVLLRPIFGEKLKTAPHPPKEIGCRSCEVHVVIRPEKAFEFRILAEKSVLISVKTFFFWDHLFLGWKNVWISVYGRKISLNFGEDLFFLEIICFWAEKTFEIPNFPRNSILMFGQTVWFWFKNNENSGQGRLHFSHSFKKAPPPPFPNPGYAPACVGLHLYIVVLSC